MSESAQFPVQLLACQGGAQLVAALAAAGLEHPLPAGSSCGHSVLVIHDLYSPDGQHEQFAAKLTRLAEQVASWRNIVYLSPDRVQPLWAINRRQGRAAARSKLVRLLGIDRCDELVLGQNHCPVNDLLVSAFPTACRVCYGDSIGVNFSPEYFLPARSRLTRLRGYWAGWKRRRLKRNRRWTPSDCAEYRLLLPNLFDEQLPRVRQLDPKRHVELFAQMGGMLDGPLVEHYRSVASRLEGCTEVIALLDSCFSEVGRMSCDHECDAYEQFVESLEPAEGAGLLLKPHPRDSAAKVERLLEMLSPRFRRVQVLDDEVSFYLPFEVALQHVLSLQLHNRLRVACFSDVCLSLHYLYGVPCLIGFGEELVRRHFPADRVETRLQHERDLRHVIRDVTPLTRGRAA